MSTVREEIGGIVEFILKLTGYIKTYRKTAAIGVIAIIGALEAFGFTGLGETLQGLWDAIFGVVPAITP